MCNIYIKGDPCATDCTASHRKSSQRNRLLTVDYSAFCERDWKSNIGINTGAQVATYMGERHLDNMNVSALFALFTENTL